MFKENKEPYIINFSSIGDSNLGYISVAENSKLPFETKRVYWTYFTPNNVERGNHAHKQLEQVIIATSGIIHLTIENRKGEISEFVLDKPEKGLYIPPYHWRKIKFSHSSVLLCLASMEYDEKDYIRDYETYQSLVRE